MSRNFQQQFDCKKQKKTIQDEDEFDQLSAEAVRLNYTEIMQKNINWELTEDENNLVNAADAVFQDYEKEEKKKKKKKMKQRRKKIKEDNYDWFDESMGLIVFFFGLIMFSFSLGKLN